MAPEELDRIVTRHAIIVSVLVMESI